jgi:outer membrane protein insertion porin family
VVQVLAAPVAPPVVAQSDSSLEIESVSVSGLQRLREDVVLTGLTIKQGDVLVGNYAAKLNEAADALYDTGWFRAKPVLSLDEGAGGGTVLKVEVLENPPYKGTKLTGNTLFSTARLMQEIEGQPGPDGQLTGGKLAKGEVINMRKLYAALDSMLSVYHNAGYIAAGVADHSIGFVGEDEGMLFVQIAEGLIDEVIVTGLNHTKESVVDSQITHLRPGSVLMRENLERDMGQIYNTGLFENVQPDLQPSLKEGYVKVVITVAETTTGQAGFGLGYSTLNGLQGTISYNEKNLFGTGKQLGAMVTFSRNQPSVDLNFADPYFTDNSFWNVGVFSTHTLQQRNVNTAYESELKVDTKGASVGYGQHINDFDTWQASFGVTDYDYTIRKGDPFYGYTPEHRARLSASGETRKLGLTFSHDTRDNQFSSTQGYLGKVTGELAGFGGDFNFNKWTVEGREFLPAGHGTLAFRQRVGLANGDVPIYEEYSYGGVNSIRGLSEDIVTGTHSLLVNSEYRYPLTKMFGVVGFVDSGWAGDSFSGMNRAVGAGIGARIRLKMLGLGAVRLDYGWELAGEEGTSSRFHFFLGEMF